MKSILVADDDRSMARTLSDILRRRGWEPTEVHSGEAAVEAAAARRYAAVLMDVRMPGMNGVEAFREIHASQPRTPVILMTAYAAPELLAEGRARRRPAASCRSRSRGPRSRACSRRSTSGPAASWSWTTTRPSWIRSKPCSPAGRHVWRAGSVEQAVALLAEQPPRVVVLDLAVDGLEPRGSVLRDPGGQPDGAADPLQRPRAPDGRDAVVAAARLDLRRPPQALPAAASARPPRLGERKLS